MSHLALIIPGLDRIGGAERQIILLATGLAKRGWRVSVIALSGSGGDAAENLSRCGIAFRTLGMRKGLADPRGWIRFHQWLGSESPAIVHAHLPHAVWLARWSRPAAPMPVLVDTLHSSSTGSLGRRLGYRFSNWLPDCVTAVSDAVADAHRSAGMVSDEKLLVIPNGVNVDTWRPNPECRDSLRRELGFNGEFVWLAAGRLEPVKDYPTLLRAMAAVPEPSRLVIAGSGLLQSELIRLASTLGIAHRVRFLGFEPNLLSWMQAADGFVLSSLWEGLPMGLLEAAACGLPAVATDVAGSREVIVEGQTGFLTEAGNSLALSRAMVMQMQSSPEARHAMGSQARRRAVEFFSLEVVLDRWESLYGALLENALQPHRKLVSG